MFKIKREKYIFNSSKDYSFIYKSKASNSIDNFNSKWLSITKMGDDFYKITVKGSNNNEGYSWDGCTPKYTFNIGGYKFIVGTPDGNISPITDKPYTYYASMMHDALYQYKGRHDITRKEVDLIFRMTLNRDKWRYAVLYWVLVRLLGGVFGKW